MALEALCFQSCVSSVRIVTKRVFFSLFSFYINKVITLFSAYAVSLVFLIECAPTGRGLARAIVVCMSIGLVGGLTDVRSRKKINDLCLD